MFLPALFSFVLVQANALDSVREAFKNKNSFEVSFEQKIEQEIFPDEASVAKGRVKFKRPDSLRWIYESPDKKEIVFESGDGFILRDGEKEEIPDARALGVEESFGFLWGETNLKNFELKELKPNQVELKPKSKTNAQFEKMIIDIRDRKIQKVQVVDRLGGKSFIQFKDWKWR